MSSTGDGRRTMETGSKHRVEIEWDQREPVSVAVQTALSEVEGRDVMELDPLAHYVDPDALESFFSGTPEELAARSLSFEYGDYVVHIDGTGYVFID